MTMALEIERVTKSFPGFTLDAVSFSLPRGYIMGCIGPNGAGKSTLIKCMMNLLHPDGGSVRVAGLDSRREELAIHQLVGYVAETHPFYQEMTAGWTGRFYARLYRYWDDALFAALLDKFQVPPHKKVKDLSKGTRAKLSLALALSHHPEVLILDEPMSGLGPLARHDLLQEMLSFIRDDRKSVFFSTHLWEDVARVADYVAVLHEGRLLLCREKDDLMADWKRLTFPAARAAEMAPWLVTARADGLSASGVTDRYREFSRQCPDLARDCQAAPLDLEELLRAAVARATARS